MPKPTVNRLHSRKLFWVAYRYTVNSWFRQGPRMSASGQIRTLLPYPDYVCFRRRSRPLETVGRKGGLWSFNNVRLFLIAGSVIFLAGLSARFEPPDLVIDRDTFFFKCSDTGSLSRQCAPVLRFPRCVQAILLNLGLLHWMRAF